jgi:hypothetical protein
MDDEGVVRMYRVERGRDGEERGEEKRLGRPVGVVGDDFMDGTEKRGSEPEPEPELRTPVRVGELRGGDEDR